jgi:PAS domain S-box-containing protein
MTKGWENMAGIDENPKGSRTRFRTSRRNRVGLVFPAGPPGWLLAGAAGSTAILAACAVTIGLVLPYEQGSLHTSTVTEHAHAIADTARQVLADARDTAIKQLVFHRNGSAGDFAASRQAIWDTQRSLVVLRGMMSDNPSQQDRLGRLGDMLASMDRIVALAEADQARIGTGLPPGTGYEAANGAESQPQVAGGGQDQRLLQQQLAGARDTERQGIRIVTAVSFVVAAAALLSAGGLLGVTAAAKAAKRGRLERHRLRDPEDLAAVMVRDLDGTIRFWSDGCERLYGWTAAEAMGQLSHVLLQTIYPQPQAEIAAILSDRGEWSGEVRHCTRFGADIVVFARKVMHRKTEILVMESLTNPTSLRRTEAALQTSRASLQSVVATAADGIIVAREDGRIVSINRAGLRMFGYEQETDLIGRDLGLLMPATEAARHGTYVAAHRAGAPPRVIGVSGRELLAVRQDGSVFPIDLSVSSFDDNGARFLTGIIRDATVRKVAEKALRDSEARFRLVQQVGEIASAEWSRSGAASFVSENYHRLYGLPPRQPAGTFEQWLDLVHPMDRERVTLQTQLLKEKPYGAAVQFRILCADETVRWIAMRAESFRDPDGSLRVISGHQDITDMVAARETLALRRDELERQVDERTAALVDAELQFRAVFDSQFQFVVLLTPVGTVQLANRTALKAPNLGVADIVGHPLYEAAWWPQAERESVQARIAEAAAGVLVRYEVEVLDRQGRGLWIDVSLKPMHDPATGQVKRIIAEWRDVTERHDFADKLAQAQKVQALGQLAGGIAHDFNNMLQSISGAATLIERRPQDLEQTRRLAQWSIEAATRGAFITKRLLSLAHRGPLAAEVIGTTELLYGMRAVLAHTLGNHITVRVSAPVGPPPLLADRGQLETVLVNLATNARDAMPDGGILTLSAEAVGPVDVGARPDTLTAGWYVRISVADTGSGMDAATVRHMAEPFFTTKPLGSGAGLGLAMVKAFTEQSGGAMAITSNLGAGTTVDLWLPQAMDDTVLNRVEDNQAVPIRTTVTRIMLVDDDDLVRETVAAQMEELGCSTIVACSGSEAVALIEAGAAFDALVSDLSMPGMNGLDTIRKARTLRPGLPCFLLTGYVGDRAALEAGDDFTIVHKPVSGRKLAARIEAGLETADVS